MDLVFWDEAVMQHRHIFEAVDRTFQDIRDDPRPFGGIVVCFCGDFRQILPVIPKGTCGQIVAACLKRSPLWRLVQLLPLTINMHLLNPTMHPDECRQQEEFANCILVIGEGRDTVNETVRWPVQGIVRENSVDELAKAVYPDLTNPNVPPPYRISGESCSSCTKK